MYAFFTALDARIAPYNLLEHPFYQAWSTGELTREELREYASEYWHHVSSFPTYLSALHARLEDAPLRRTVLENLADEEAIPGGRPHSELWMDFATGMGAQPDDVRSREVQPETIALVEHFRQAMQAAPAAALATLYTYESRVPAIARTKAEGLRAHYGADAATARYFTLHQTADVHHAPRLVWLKQRRRHCGARWMASSRNASGPVPFQLEDLQPSIAGVDFRQIVRSLGIHLARRHVT
jgi:pyrroloquinoline-quinone synthase